MPCLFDKNSAAAQKFFCAAALVNFKFCLVISAALCARIAPVFVGQAEKIVYRDVVIVRKFYKHRNGRLPLAVFVLRIGVLPYVKVGGKLGLLYALLFAQFL